MADNKQIPQEVISLDFTEGEINDLMNALISGNIGVKVFHNINQKVAAQKKKKLDDTTENTSKASIKSPSK